MKTCYSNPTYSETDQELSFESFLADWSTHFAQVRNDQVDHAIDRCQRSLCEDFALDRSGLWQATGPSESSVRLTHLYQRAAANNDGLPPIVIWDADHAAARLGPPHLTMDAQTVFPWMFSLLREGENVMVSSIDDLPEHAARDREMLVREGTKSTVVLPLMIAGNWRGLVTFHTTDEERIWTETDARRLRLVADLFASALARARAESALSDREQEIKTVLERSASEIKVLKERLRGESDYLRDEIKVNGNHTQVVGQSRGIKKVLQQVEQVAPVNCPVLITGESGTGKELISQAIHRLSPRANRTMVIVNCAALPAGLIESELFGREKGAFTGALSSQAGRFEMADLSTIFLDEVTELPLELQGKLLRVLQEGEYARLGNPRTRKVDVRVIAATNRELGEEVRKGRFREDLYYRLSVFPIQLPPLRERAEDIPLLVFSFLEELSSRMGKKISKVPRRVMETLERHYWPGNIRELRNAIERGVIISSGDTLRVALSNQLQPACQPVTLAEVERQHILTTLEKTDWHIKGPHGAAKILDLKPGTLYSRMRKLGVPHRRQKDAMPT